MMQRFSGGDSNAVDDITTDNESWIYCYDPEIKRQSARWVFPFEELSTKVKRGLALCALPHSARQTNKYLETLGVQRRFKAGWGFNEENTHVKRDGGGRRADQNFVSELHAE
ncbi:hypothetical protein EVAR_37546_1 [Eumeta japonica]|uniref:Uncharacterized protein n=1 Tax=Eumeta variegata TaxID=151549 RepID=A0A4C1XU38_EUMVA|nr:hypothetical protein EVAR_37546_1 [Eumeta japonica]